MELLPTIDALDWIADNGPEHPRATRTASCRSLLQAEEGEASPTSRSGSSGVIAPWNYPWSIPFGEVAIALMAGNGVVLKPASLTPLIGEKIRAAFERAGLPEGLVRTVHGGGAVGNALVESSAAQDLLHGLGRGRAGRGRGVRRAA